jgi:hypothetical protein
MLKKVEIRKTLSHVVREQITEVVGVKAREEACRRATALSRFPMNRWKAYPSDTLGTRTCRAW